MPRYVLLLAFAAAAFPALAEKRVTIAELKQFLAAESAAHKSDGWIADHLIEMELTEQLTNPTLDRMTADIKPGKKTAQSLELLADRSAFLEPPPSEIPSEPAPKFAEQERLLQGAVDFANVTLARLPNFLATRATRTFENLDSSGNIGMGTVRPVSYERLHESGEYSRQITYRDGHEVKTDAAHGGVENDKRGETAEGLTSTGEFGLFLQEILAGSAKGKIVWSHWEKTRTGVAAVLSYEVPQEASHYAVDVCCVLFVPRTGSGERNSGTRESFGRFHATPGYHGYLYLDPETGAVMRATLEATMGSNDPVTRMGTWVDYGNVEIGGREFLCPVRSTAFQELRGATPSEPGLMRLNEVTFTNYHRFGSTAQILPAKPEP